MAEKYDDLVKRFSGVRDLVGAELMPDKVCWIIAYSVVTQRVNFFKGFPQQYTILFWCIMKKEAYTSLSIYYTTNILLYIYSYCTRDAKEDQDYN